MSKNATDALHDIHTATHDVLKGYREMATRAEPEIVAVIERLTALHQRHAAEQQAELVRLQDADKDDSSFQGTVNKAVVILRDWVSSLDRDVLPAVRSGEESLRDEYDKALKVLEPQQAASVTALLQTQRASIDAEIARLPSD